MRCKPITKIPRPEAPEYCLTMKNNRLRLTFALILLIPILTSAVNAQSLTLSQLLSQGRYDDAVEIATNSDHYLSELFAMAETKALASSYKWRALLRYRTSLFGGWESEVDGEQFFLSRDGKHDPEQELRATLAAFFSNQRVAPFDLSNQCRFIARFTWLQQQLNFDERMPRQQCEHFENFYQLIKPQSITIIFPTAYPSSAASMFGHTLVRIDKRDQDKETRMLAYSINYAATVPKAVNPLSYTVRGLTGGYPGRYSVLPYFMKLREYGQIENRDIWEYKLTLTPEQIKPVVMHAYELATTHFDYFFFSENCSYHVVSLLDVALDDDAMAEEYGAWTVPVDTLKTLQRRGLVEHVEYSASQARVIRQRRALLAENEREWVRNAFESGFTSQRQSLQNFAPARQALMLDLLADYLRYDRFDSAEEQVASSLGKRERKVLLTRSRLGIASPKLEIPAPTKRPDHGHGSQRLGLHRGVIDEDAYTELEWRMAYHDLLDPSDGFLANNSIQFARLSARHDSVTRQTKLHSLQLLEITTLQPWDELFSAFSWHVQTGWQRQLSRRDVYRQRVYLEGGPGLSYALDGNQTHTLYAFADFDYHYGKIFEKEYRFAAGASFGLTTEPVNGWRLHLSAKRMAAMSGDERDYYRLQLGQGVRLSPNLSLRLDLSRQEDLAYRYDEGRLSLMWYY